MKVIAISVTALLLHGAAHAEQKRHPFAVHAEGLIRNFIGPPKDAQYDMVGMLEQERARSYLSGVKDASVGTHWCYPGRIKPDELDWVIIAELQKLPADVLRGMAAPLIVNALAAKFPCGAAKP